MLTRITPQKHQSKGLRFAKISYKLLILSSFLVLGFQSKSIAQTELFYPRYVEFNKWYFAAIIGGGNGTIDKQVTANSTYSPNIDVERIGSELIRFRIRDYGVGNTNISTSAVFKYQLSESQNGFDRCTVNVVIPIQSQVQAEATVTTPSDWYSSVEQFGNQQIPLKVNVSNNTDLKLFRVDYTSDNIVSNVFLVDQETLSPGITDYDFTHNVSTTSRYFFSSNGSNPNYWAVQSNLFKYEKLFTITSNNFGFCWNEGWLSCEVTSRVPFKSRHSDIFNNISFTSDWDFLDIQYYTQSVNSVLNGIQHSQKLSLTNYNIDTRLNTSAGYWGYLTLADGRTVNLQIGFGRVQPEPIVIEPVSDPCLPFVTFSTRGPSWMEDKPIPVMWKNLKTGETFGPSEFYSFQNTDDGNFGIEIQAMPASSGPTCLLNSETIKIPKLGYLPIPSCEKTNHISLASRLTNYKEPLVGKYVIRRVIYNRPPQQNRSFISVVSGFERTNDGSFITLEGLPDNDSEDSFYQLEVINDETEPCKTALFKIFGRQAYLNNTDFTSFPLISLEGTVFVPNRNDYDNVTARRHSIKIKSLTKVYFLPNLENEDSDPFEQNASNVEKNSFDLDFQPDVTELPGIKADLIFHNCIVDIEYPVVFTSQCKMWNGMTLINSKFCLHAPVGTVPEIYKDTRTGTYATFSNAIKAISTYPDKNMNKFTPEKEKFGTNFSITKTKLTLV